VETEFTELTKLKTRISAQFNYENSVNFVKELGASAVQLKIGIRGGIRIVSADNFPNNYGHEKANEKFRRTGLAIHPAPLSPL